MICTPPRPTMPKRRPKAPQGVPKRLQVSMGHKIQSVRDANIKPHSHLTESVWGGLVLDICLGLIFGERGLIFSVPGLHLVEGIQKNNNVLISLA